MPRRKTEATWPPDPCWVITDEKLGPLCSKERKAILVFTTEELADSFQEIVGIDATSEEKPWSEILETSTSGIRIALIDVGTRTPECAVSLLK